MKLPLSLLAMSLTSLFGMNLHAKPLEVGAPAPVLTVPDQDGKPVNLADVYARGITLVYFYPKASTPGCTAQACSLRDSISELKGLGVEVVGVSKDTAAAQKAFAEKYQLPFTLLADADGQVIAAFGVPTLPLGFSQRQSFLVKDGKIAWHSAKAQTATHAAEVEAAIAELRAAN